MPTQPPVPSTPSASSPPDPFRWIDDEARRRERSGLVRTLRPRQAESALLDLAGNDYLGLTHHPVTTGAAADAARRWGAGATGSRLVTGTTAPGGGPPRRARQAVRRPADRHRRPP
ncbi:hypothetical protein AB0R12_38460, partial [Streptomyces niveus]